MTAVTIYKRSGQYAGFTVEGHAGYAEEGQDIVCAAVSVLLRTAIHSLSAVPGIKVTADAPERGNVSFRVCMEQTPLQDAAAYMLRYARTFLANGFSDLAAEYPDYVSFREHIIEIE